jgi:RNA polymerase I-specific transcription initiation factor RRN7
VDIYIAARRLAKLLKTDYSFPSNLAKHSVTVYPESQIISLVVIATKLSQPFDEIVRAPESIADPSSLTIDWGDWIQAMKEAPKDGIRRGHEIKVTDDDVFKMSDKKLDDYLDWYQRTWIDDNGNSKCECPAGQYTHYYLYLIANRSIHSPSTNT